HPWLCQASSAGTKTSQTAGSSPARINNSAYNKEDRERPERERKDTGTTSWSEPAKRRLTTIPGRVIRLAGQQKMRAGKGPIPPPGRHSPKPRPGGFLFRPDSLY